MKKYLSLALASLGLCISSLSMATPTYSSVYTSVATQACKTLKSNPNEGGSYSGLCPGVGGYQLILLEGDIRQTLTVVTPNKKEFPLEFWRIVSPHFSAIGNKVEWRVQKNAGKTTPVALIARYNVSEHPEKPEKNTSYLVVSKITKDAACVTDIVKPQANANVLARRLADTAATKACKANS